MMTHTLNGGCGSGAVTSLAMTMPGVAGISRCKGKPLSQRTRQHCYAPYASDNGTVMAGSGLVSPADKGHVQGVACWRLEAADVKQGRAAWSIYTMHDAMHSC